MTKPIDGMVNGEITFIPDRLIAEPVVFRGLTDSEVVMLMAVGVVFWIPVSVLLLWPLGFALFGVGVGLGLAIVTLLVAGKWLTRIKRKMPDGLHVVYLKHTLQRRGLMSFGYLHRTGHWDIRRRDPVVRRSEFDE